MLLFVGDGSLQMTVQVSKGDVDTMNNLNGISSLVLICLNLGTRHCHPAGFPSNNYFD